MPFFSPSPSDKLDLFDEEFIVQEHPAVPKMAYAQEGSRATTYKIRDQLGDDFALKVFKAQFRDPRQPQIAEQLSRYRTFQGLRAADRRVVPAGDHTSSQGLELAVVMPWIQGYTWFDLLTKPKRTDKRLRTEVAVHLCWRFLLVLRALEDLYAAHTDIASGNLIIDMESFEVQLIDLEEMYAPRFTPPKKSRRTPGYTRDKLGSPDDGFWVREGDRLAGAILAAEMLALSDSKLAAMSYGDSFFEAPSIGDPDAPRFRAVVNYLHTLSPRFSQLFERAWKAATLAACPTIAELTDSIEPLAKAAPVPIGDPFIDRTAPSIPVVVPAAPIAPPTSSGVTWIPLSGLGAAPATSAQGTRPIPTATQPIPSSQVNVALSPPVSVAQPPPADPALAQWLDLFMQDGPGKRVSLISPPSSSRVTIARAPAGPPLGPRAMPPTSPTAQRPTTGPPTQDPTAARSRPAAPAPISVVLDANALRARPPVASVDRFDVIHVSTTRPLPSPIAPRSSEPVPDMAALKRSIALPIVFVALILGLMAIVVLFLRSLT